MGNAIRKRNYYAFKILLDAPLSVKSGEQLQTDGDVLRNGGGEPFLPGTSIAGAFRGFLDEKTERKQILGYAENHSRMSSMFISDLYFDEGAVVSVRDGIRLGEDRLVDGDGKFDSEIVETGARGTLYISYILREEDEELDIDGLMNMLAVAMNEGQIRFGSGKNRGRGKVRVEEVYVAEYDAATVDDWLEFQQNRRDVRRYPQCWKLEEWAKAKDRRAEYVFMTVPLRLTGGISIRRYSTKPEVADFEQITCNDKPVIPGSSWGGVIRSGAKALLREAGFGDGGEWLEPWFGYVKKTEQGESEACQSMVVVEESILEGGTALPMGRNRIDRFSSAVQQGALFSEIAWFQGRTTLRIGVRKDRNKHYEALLGLLLLVVKDIQDGYVAVGGQSAVGRGIFAGDGEIVFSEECEEQALKQSFAEFIRTGGAS
ncbi:MAG: hypothetical protein KHZ58_09970 [Hungatella hathewayi]|nr:hypothetical protein [Hungatella hathewayi]